tara:strand:+ start:132 stop:254 length:123 start_codon:yes stop_codon:yes gene_type:complete
MSVVKNAAFFYLERRKDGKKMERERQKNNYIYVENGVISV